LTSGASNLAPDFALAAHAPMAMEPGELMLTPPPGPAPHVEQQPLLDLGLDEERLAAMDDAALRTGDEDRLVPAAFDAVLHLEEAPGHDLASDWTEAAEPQQRHGVSPARRPDEIRAVAELCVRLGRVGEARELLMVLEDATTLLDAIGLILWTWDPRARALRPALSHGYSEEQLSQVPPVPPESDNAIGSAFRSAETRIVNGDDLATGALAVPLITPSGCTGVLAAEFRDSGEQHEWVRGVVTILAAQLSMLVLQPAALRAATA
jgi:GAF domain-containing protein